MEKRVFIFVALLTIFLSGCITLEVTEIISRDGESQVTIKYDMRQLVAMMAEMSEEEAETDFCKDFEQREGSKIIDANCTSQNGLITITGKIIHTNQEFESQTNILRNRYIYYVSRGMAFVDEMGEEDAGGSFQGNQYLKSMGAKFTYKVEMPVKITSATHGVIDKNTLTIDLFEMSENEEIRIIAEEYNYVAIGVILAILVLMLLGLILVLRGKSKQEKIEMPIETQESYKI